MNGWQLLKRDYDLLSQLFIDKQMKKKSKSSFQHNRRTFAASMRQPAQLALLSFVFT